MRHCGNSYMTPTGWHVLATNGELHQHSPDLDTDRSTSRCPRPDAQSVLARCVAEAEHAGLEGLCAQELQGNSWLVGREQPSHSLTDNDRMHEQVELVDEALPQQPADSGGAAGHGDVATITGLEVDQLLGHVAADDLRVLPLRRLEAVGDHVLLDGVDHVTERLVGMIGPVRGPLVV